jgi:hypothetical protein
MEDNTGNTIALIIGLILVVGVGIGGGLWFNFYRVGNDPFKIEPLGKSTKSTQETSTNSGRKREDINDDGAVNGDDSQIVSASIGCSQVQSCWDDVIGKTLSGDNPIYVYDLDVDDSGEINDNDVAQIKAAMGV